MICYACRAANGSGGSPAWHHWCKARRLGTETEPSETLCDCQHVGETSADGVVAPPLDVLWADQPIEDLGVEGLGVGSM